MTKPPEPPLPRYPPHPLGPPPRAAGGLLPTLRLRPGWGGLVSSPLGVFPPPCAGSRTPVLPGLRPGRAVSVPAWHTGTSAPTRPTPGPVWVGSTAQVSLSQALSGTQPLPVASVEASPRGRSQDPLRGGPDGRAWYPPLSVEWLSQPLDALSLCL